MNGATVDYDTIRRGLLGPQFQAPQLQDLIQPDPHSGANAHHLVDQILSTGNSAITAEQAWSKIFETVSPMPLEIAHHRGGSSQALSPERIAIRLALTEKV